MLHYKELSYNENVDDLKKYKQILKTVLIEVKDDKVRFSKRALDKDPLEWFRIITKRRKYNNNENS